MFPLIKTTNYELFFMINTGEVSQFSHLRSSTHVCLTKLFEVSIESWLTAAVEVPIKIKNTNGKVTYRYITTSGFNHQIPNNINVFELKVTVQRKSDLFSWERWNLYCWNKCSRFWNKTKIWSKGPIAANVISTKMRKCKLASDFVTRLAGNWREVRSLPLVYKEKQQTLS